MFKPVFKNEGTSHSHPRLCRFLSERGTCTGPGAPAAAALGFVESPPRPADSHRAGGVCHGSLALMPGPFLHRGSEGSGVSGLRLSSQAPRKSPRRQAPLRGCRGPAPGPCIGRLARTRGPCVRPAVPRFSPGHVLLRHHPTCRCVF